MPRRPDLPAADLPARLPGPGATLLCDADGNLFASEDPAFAASATVTNAFLERLGSDQRWTPDELQRRALGRNFRALAGDLLVEVGGEMPADELDRWVERERLDVTDHLGRVLRPDPSVEEPLRRLAAVRPLALVSSSALARLDRCLDVTGLADLFPTDLRFSAQDSLPTPTSKPDPAVYAAALADLGLAPAEAIAVEDAASGVRSAVGAGVAVVGNLAFVPEGEQDERARELLAAGAAHVVADWTELEALLASPVVDEEVAR